MCTSQIVDLVIVVNLLWRPYLSKFTFCQALAKFTIYTLPAVSTFVLGNLPTLPVILFIHLLKQAALHNKYITCATEMRNMMSCLDNNLPVLDLGKVEVELLQKKSGLLTSYNASLRILAL